MKVELMGCSEDLIQKCAACEYCIFEDILSPEQRKNKTLDSEMPEKHVSRMAIEQLCGRYYDKVCAMKYAAMRAGCDDRTAMQMGVVKTFVWDLGKARKCRIEFNQALISWTRPQHLGRGFEESYAKRYEEIWNLGLRKFYHEGKLCNKQIFTADHIYEMVMAKPQTYERTLAVLGTLIQEHRERDAI